MAVSSTAHTGFKVMFGQENTLFIACKLTTLDTLQRVKRLFE